MNWKNQVRLHEEGLVQPLKDDNGFVIDAADEGTSSMNWAHSSAKHCALHDFFI